MLSDGRSEQVRLGDAKCIAIISIAAIMCVLVSVHANHVNGAWFSNWPWRREGALSIYGGVALAAIPLFLAQWFHFKRISKRLLLPLLMLSAAALMLVNVVVPTHAMSWALLADIVRSPQSMSYFCDAGVLRNFPGWLGQYAQVMSKLSMHSQTKPPGPILYFTFFIDLMGYTRAAAVVSGLVIGLIATFSIPATYWLVKRFSGNRDAAFFASSFLAMCPGFILIFPLFDGCYILFTVALMILWDNALIRNRIAFSVWMGILLAGMIVMTFTVLALGVFLFAYALWCTGLPRRTLIARVVRHSSVVVGVWIVALGFVWLVTGCGYNPITALQSATRNQAVLAAEVNLPGILHTLPWNLWDLSMGTGWILFPLAVFGLLRSWKQRGAHDLLTRTMILCLAMPIVLGLTGLFPVETSRVWNFLLPLLLLPVGFELMHWTANGRVVVLICLWCSLATHARNFWIVLPFRG